MMTQVVLTRIEGKEDWGPNAEIVVQIDDQLTYRFPVFQPEKRFEIPVAGKLRLLSKEQSTHCFFGSVTVQTHLLPTNQAVWLPLFDTGNDEVLEFPCEELAAAWVELTPANKILSTVLEVTEPSESEHSLRSLASLEDDKTQLRVFALMKQICDQEATFRSKEKALLERIEANEQVILADKAAIDRLLQEKTQLQSQVTSLAAKYEELREKQRDSLEHTSENFRDEFSMEERAHRRSAVDDLKLVRTHNKPGLRTGTPQCKRNKLKSEMLVPFRERKAKRIL